MTSPFMLYVLFNAYVRIELSFLLHVLCVVRLILAFLTSER